MIEEEGNINCYKIQHVESGVTAITYDNQLYQGSQRVFERSHDALDDGQKCSLWSRLPPKVKRTVVAHLLPTTDKLINLSHDGATVGVFENDHWIRPCKILDVAVDALKTSRSMRNDILTYFWTEHHFLISINMISLPRISTILFVFAAPYFNRVQNLTLEMDLTLFNAMDVIMAPSVWRALPGYEQNELKTFQTIMKLLIDKLLDGRQKRGLRLDYLHLVNRPQRLASQPVWPYPHRQCEYPGVRSA